MKKCKECNGKFMPNRKEQAYCSKSCASVSKGSMRKGLKDGPRQNWKYRKQIDRHGYVRVYARLHPFSGGRLMMLEHRMIMELQLQRKLHPSEHVHHRNGIRTDNRPENLELMKASEHLSKHGKEPNRPRGAHGRFA